MTPQDRAAYGRELTALLRASKLTEAHDLCRRALARHPDDAECHNNLANILEELGRVEEAEAAYRKALKLRPDFIEAWYNLGLLLHTQRRLEEAITAYDLAGKLQPGLAQAHNNRGAALRDLRRLGEAIDAFNMAVRVRQDYADAQFNQAMCRLMMGDFSKGWPQYEWRWRTRQADFTHRGFRQPLWLGSESLDGRTILLHAEQGFGDTIQFCRFSSDVAALGAKVVLEVQPQLERLMSGLDGIAVVVARGQPLPAFDVHTPLMSLPLALGATPEHFASRIPYLTADAASVSKWVRRLPAPKDLRIGLVWAGAPSPDHPIAAEADKRRSLPLSAFKPVLAAKDVTFFSLQKGPPAEQLRVLADSVWSRPQILDFTADIDDFADTAALIASLDLVISCDTAVAHLAGAMGKPVWILNRFDSCWRWLDGRDDSPWYPTARLFTQTSPGDWDGVIARVAEALGQWRA